MRDEMCAMCAECDSNAGSAFASDVVHLNLSPALSEGFLRARAEARARVCVCARRTYRCSAGDSEHYKLAIIESQCPHAVGVAAALAPNTNRQVL